MTGDWTLTCRMADPTDAVTRILMLSARCSIALRALAVDVPSAGSDGLAVAVFGFKAPPQVTMENFADRIRAMPCVESAEPQQGDAAMDPMADQGRLPTLQSAIATVTGLSPGAMVSV